jgi:CheY-like chemotaxis protein
MPVGDFEPKNILVVEDEKPYARALVLKLEHQGFKAKNASNGEEALAFLESERFDFILLDIVMPKMNGFVFLEEMKKRGIVIPTLVLSNLAQAEDKEKVKAFGVNGFFEKANTPIVEIINQVTELLKK